MNDSAPVLVRLTKASLSNIEPVFPGRSYKCRSNGWPGQEGLKRSSLMGEIDVRRSLPGPRGSPVQCYRQAATGLAPC